MANPVVWPTDTFYYPIGNTPPINLSESLPPETNANVLLLGCGDPRNILYTIYTSAIAPPSGKPRLDIIVHILNHGCRRDPQV